MPSANNDSFTFFLQILVPVISLFYLIAVAKTSKTMLNKNGESRCPCLVHDLKEKLLLFPLGIMLAVHLSNMVIITLSMFPLFPIC